MCHKGTISDGLTNSGFFLRETSSGINGPYTHDLLKGLLEDKDYCVVDYIFPFVLSFAFDFFGVWKLTNKHLHNCDT